MRFLRKRLTGIRVVDQPPDDTGKAYFGAWCVLRNDDGDEREYRLVGPDEFDFAPEYVSIESPLGRAVLGKAVGAAVTVRSPEGEQSYELMRVRYR